MLGAIVGGSIVSGLIGSDATKKAAETTAGAQQAATAEQARQFDIGQKNLAPYLGAGKQALNYLGSNIYGAPATFQPGDYQQSPGYQWQYQQGLNALNNQAAAGGMRLSGRALKAAEQYGQGLANQDYNQWYQRQLQAHQQNQQDYQNYLSRIYQLAGLGSGAVNTGVQQGANYANAVGNIAMQGAQNQANLGMAGAANLNRSIQSGLGNYLAYNQNQNMNNLLGANADVTNLVNTSGLF